MLRRPWILIAAVATAFVVAGVPARAGGSEWKLVVRVRGTVESLLSGAGEWTRIVQSRHRGRRG